MRTGSNLPRFLAVALRSRRLRDWLAITGVAACTLLVLVIASAFRSVTQAVESYAGQANADLWVAMPGTDNMIRGSFASMLPIEYRDSMTTIPGVAAADPVLKAFLTVQKLDSDAAHRATLLSVGYRAPGGLGGPPEFAAGRAPRGRHEIALDRAAAFRLAVHLGDTVGIAGHKVQVVGLTRGTNILATQFFFADIAASSIATDTRGKASFIVLKVQTGLDPAIVAAAVEARFPDLMVMSRRDFVNSNRREVTTGFVPMIALMGGLGMAAAAVLVGLLVNGAVEDRRDDIAILFALGAGLAPVTRGMLRGALRQAALGSVIGVLLAVILAIGLDRWMPIIPLRLTGLDVAIVVGIFVLASGVGATAPILALQNLDPMEAFRS